MQIRDRLPFLLIPLAALLAVLPLLVHGCSCGHDLNFHLLSWQEAAHQFAHGQLHPRWAFAPAFGAGEPRFVFYPPLSWTLGGLLTDAAAALARIGNLDPAQTFALVPIVFTGLALAAAGFSMLHLARRFVSPAAATLAATLYLANPYTLFTAYERSAFAELLAAALLPLLLAALLPRTDERLSQTEPSARAATLDPSAKAGTRPPRQTGQRLTATPPLGPDLGGSSGQRSTGTLALALPLSLLWLTNAPAAILGSYTVAFLVLLRLAWTLRRGGRAWPAIPLLKTTVLGSVLAFALAAFYIVPVLAERPWAQVAMAILPGLRPDDNTLFHHTTDIFHDQVLRTASLLALCLLVVTVLACLLCLRRDKLRPVAWLLAALTTAVVLLLTPLSLPLWHHLPELAFLQFPWRLLALLAPVCLLALSLLFAPLHLRPLPLAAVALLLTSLLTAASIRLFRQPCDPEDTPQARYAVFHGNAGDEPTDEYTPTTADNDSLQHTNPPFRLLALDADDDTPPPPSAHPGPAPLSLSLTLNAPARLVLNLRDYPTWRVLRNGQPDLERDHRADGLLTIPLPAGPSTLVITEVTPTAETAADIVSIVALCLVIVRLLRGSRRRPAR